MSHPTEQTDKGMLITNVAEACGIDEPIRHSARKDSVWRSMDYETMEGIRGTMIYAPTCGEGGERRMLLPALGRCRIYVAMATYADISGVFLKLENEAEYRCIRAFGASFFPEVSEYFYREADLDGRALIIRRYPEITSLAWVRLEPVAETKKAEPPPLEVLVTQDGYNTATFEDYLDKIAPLRDVRTGKFFFCMAHGDHCPHFRTQVGTPGVGENTAFVRPIDREIAVAMGDLMAKHPDFIPELIDYVHGQGMEFHGSVRIGAFYLPGFPMGSRFFLDHPEHYCRLTNGTEVSRLSLAEPEVRRHWLDLFREIISFDCDGLHLILTRALPFVLFEPAFCSLFEAKYGLSPLNLPEDDGRILQLRAEIVTAFLRDVRALLDGIGAAKGRHLQFTLTVPPNETVNRSFGLDLRSLAAAGIIDNITADGALLVRDHNESPFNIDFAYFRDAVRGTACRWYPRLPGFPDSPAVLPEYLRKSLAHNASGVLLWDGCESFMPRAEYWEPLATLMRDLNDATEWPVRRLHPLRTLDGFDWDRYAPHNGF